MLTAGEAAAQLGVKLGTLYAYVSRGWLKSYRRKVGRQALYRRADIEALRGVIAPERGVRARSLPDASSWVTVAQPPSDGSSDRRHRRRIRSQLDHRRQTRLSRLSDRRTGRTRLVRGGLPPAMEWRAAAARGDRSPARGYRRRAPTGAGRCRARSRRRRRAAAAAPRRDDAEPGRRRASPAGALAHRPGPHDHHGATAGTRAAGARGAASPPAALHAPPAETPGWPRGFAGARSRDPAAADCEALDRVLVACAEHELNASTFAARVVASTGADLYASVLAALCSLSGPIHGGACDRIESMFAELDAGTRIEQALDAFGAKHSLPPGFGHTIYPSGDPRAALLKRVARATAKRKGRKLFETALKFEEAVWKRARLRPNLDFYLTVCVRMVGFPRGMPAAIFAMGRAAGWIAHSLEQSADNRLIRPRMRYHGSPLRHWQ